MLTAAALELGELAHAERFLRQLRTEYAAAADGQLITWEFGGLQHMLSTRLLAEQAANSAVHSTWIPALIDLTYLLRLPKSPAVSAQIEQVCASLLPLVAPDASALNP